MQPDQTLIIRGGTPLRGAVQASGAKNAALPVLAACFAFAGVSVIRNVPNVLDVRRLLEMMEIFGAKISFENGTARLDCREVEPNFDAPRAREIAGRLRASVLLLAPFLRRFGTARLGLPGGCFLGKRPLGDHIAALTAFGARFHESATELHATLENGEFAPATFTLPKASVTATENALVAAACANGKSQISLAATEPHVQNVANILGGVSGAGTPWLRVVGDANRQQLEGEIGPDPLEAASFLLAGAITGGTVRVKGARERDLQSFLQKLGEVGVRFSVLNEDEICVEPGGQREPADISTAVFPGFPTDLHPPFAALLLFCHGKSRIFETLFERKFAYLFEFEKMGAQVELLTPHQFVVRGGRALHGARVSAQDIRAGTAVVLAALGARGETEISGIEYLHRGYEGLAEKLQHLGAQLRFGGGAGGGGEA